MRLPRINWTKVAENLAACDPYGAVLMADGSIQTCGGQVLAPEPAPAEPVDREERYEAWCRRGARAIHPVPARS
jgi:rRNA maturation protein Nop10